MIANAQIFQSPSTQDPSAVFQITATLPRHGNILFVSTTAGTILPGQVVTSIFIALPYGATILPYGTQGTTGTGGTGSYALSAYGGLLINNSETMIVTLSPVGLAGPGSLWYQTDTTYLFNRNTANTGWTFVGPVNINFLGLLPRAGGVVTEPITGSTGLMTEDGITPFSGVPYVNSKNSLAATLADLADAQTNLEEQISAGISQVISAIGLPSLNANIVIGFGQIGVYSNIPVVTPPSPSPIPISGLTYGNGNVVQLSECHGIATNNTITQGGSGLFVFPTDTVYFMTWNAYGEFPISPPYDYASMNYQFIAIRTGA